ncbi:MAG: hypothetical protein C4531_07100 [Desulfurivibrio sp.]|nr:MAG: hypothetical protein C4531_07100 [Desulfurivibrio sp.]
MTSTAETSQNRTASHEFDKSLTLTREGQGSILDHWKQGEPCANYAFAGVKTGKSQIKHQEELQ